MMETVGVDDGQPPPEAVAPVVFCIVLNLNGKALLLETLASLAAMTYPNFKIVVVDNGSTDGSPAAVRAQFPGVTLLENRENLGYGEGNNVGIRYALANGAAWVFLLNNDIVVDPLLLSELIAASRTDARIGLLGAKIYYATEPNKIWYAGGRVNFFMGLTSHRGIRQEDRGQFDRVVDTDYITGCALLINRAVLDRIGMFDPVYFPSYSEDADLSMRARRAGFRLLFVPTAKLWHKVSSFSGGGLTPLKTRLKVEHNLIFFKRYARWYHWLTIPLFVVAGAVVFIIRETLKGNFRVVAALLQGFSRALGKSKARHK